MAAVRHFALALSFVVVGSCSRRPDPALLERAASIEGSLAELETRLAQLEPPHQSHALEPVSEVPGTTFSVTITQDRMFLRGKPVAPDDLPQALEALATRTPRATIAVQADATVAHARVVALVDTLRDSGFSSIAIATRPVH